MPKVAQTIRPLIKKACIVMSIACGVSLGTLAGMLGDDKKILRVMPNTLIKSGNGYSAACVNPNIDEDDKTLITAVLNALGQTMYVTEDMFETFTAFCCTGPIWLYKTVETLVDAGVYAGFSRMESRNMVIKNMLGVAQVLDNTGAYPAKQVDDMTSPGRRDDRSAAGAAAEGLRRNAHELRRRRRQKGKFDPLSKANQQAASPPRRAGRREKPHREEREMTNETKTKLAGSADAGRLLYLV